MIDNRQQPTGPDECEAALHKWASDESGWFHGINVKDARAEWAIASSAWHAAWQASRDHAAALHAGKDWEAAAQAAASDRFDELSSYDAAVPAAVRAALAVAIPAVEAPLLATLAEREAEAERLRRAVRSVLDHHPGCNYWYVIMCREALAPAQGVEP